MARVRTRARALSAFSSALSIIVLGFVALSVPKAALARIPPHADKILVIKHERLLFLLDHGRVIRTYPIALGWDPIGPKEREGDGRTPEGHYIIDGRNPHSAYDLSLHISYPNASDVVIARDHHFNPGGEIYIHGLPNGFGDPDLRRFYKDWTNGCIAVSDQAIRQIWNMVSNGTPIVIEP